MYKELAHELQKPNPDILKLVMFLANGRPQNFFDKMLNGLFHSPSLGLFTETQENTFFHSLAQKGILSPILYTIDRHKENILRREEASLDDLCRSLNTVNNDGLTPAHIAVKTDPVALWWLTKFKAALTSKDYSLNVLSVYTNKKSNKKSPLEYIFEDEKITKNVFLKILESDHVDFFDLFKGEIPIVQEKFNEHLKHIRHYAKEFGGSIATSAFRMLFQSYWEYILVDEPEFSKVKRLMDVLDPEVEGLVLSIEDLSGLLKSESSSIDEIRISALEQCAFLYLNKFLLPDEKKYNILKLEHATLERIIGSPKFNTLNFQAIKHYVEGLPDNSTTDNSTNVTTVVIAPNQSDKLEESPVKQDTQDTTPKSDPITVDGISLKEVDLIMDKEDSNGTVNHISTSEITKSSTEFKSKVEADVSAETFAQEIFNIFKEDEDCAEKIKDEKYSQIHALIYFASDEELFNNLFNDLANDFETQKNLKVPFKDASSFFEEYIKTLPLESLIAVSSKPKLIKQNKGQTPYELACKVKNDQVAKFLAQRGVELKLYTRETETLFQFAFKYKCQDTIQYLLFESGLAIDWCYVLHQIFKYTNTETAEDYANSSFDVVKNTTNKGSEPSKDGEYTVLNKGLSILKQLSRSLIKYDNSVASNQKKLLYQSKINNIKKIPELCKIIELLIEKEKLYYGAENDHIAAKTYTLLNGIKSYISKISESLDKIVIDIESELDSDYCDKIKKALKSLNKKLLNSSCQDEIKEALGFLNESILDEEYRDEVEEALKSLNKNVLDGEYQAEVKEALKSLNKNLLNRNYQDRIEDALNSMDNLQSLVINKYPSDELNDAHKKMFENLKSGKVDYAPSLAGTSNPDVSICSGSQLSEYELSGDTDSVYNA